jgi:hypothetical protein
VLDAEGIAVGRIDSVLRSASGVRLVMARAFSRGGFIACLADRIAQTESDAFGLVWHTLAIGIEELTEGGVYRREMGRLVRDPFPAPYGATRPDDVVLTDVRAALDEDALTRNAELTVRVSHGVAVLSGWIDTVGGKVIAERIARVTPGVWDAVNRLTSDDELLGALRSGVRRAGGIADSVQAVRVQRGAVRLTLLPGGESAAEALRAACLAVPGVREVEVALIA